MSAQIKFFCDFCGKEVTTDSINKDHMAFCIPPGKYPTNCLTSELKGPHICYTCLINIYNNI